jgi:hypothetical protein
VIDHPKVTVASPANPQALQIERPAGVEHFVQNERRVNISEGRIALKADTPIIYWPLLRVTDRRQNAVLAPVR